MINIVKSMPPLKVIESSNIRKKLLNEILDFQNLLLRYYDEDVEDDEKEIYLKKITAHLKKSSPFTAFKLWIIKDNAIFKQTFGVI